MQILFSGAVPGRLDVRGVTAMLGILDLESGTVIHRCEYRTPTELQAPEQKMQFTGYSFLGDRLYVCAHNEVVWFEEWPPVQPAGRISDPGFNDLHHCLPWGDGLAIANTGLETVDHMSLDGVLLRRWDLLGDFAEARTIDPNLEYRRIPDTKPHRVHANHLFVRDRALWVTQLRTSRAVSVTEPGGEVAFDVGMPHDGRPADGALVFTTTNGFLVEVDPSSLEVVANHDLARMTCGLDMLGWCRGVCRDARDSDCYYVGFSLTRPTRWKRYARWIKEGSPRPPSRIDRYDVGRGKLLESHRIVPEHDLVIFQLDLLPERLWI